MTVFFLFFLSCEFWADRAAHGGWRAQDSAGAQERCHSSLPPTPSSDTGGLSVYWTAGHCRGHDGDVQLRAHWYPARYGEDFRKHLPRSRTRKEQERIEVMMMSLEVVLMLTVVLVRSRGRWSNGIGPPHVEFRTRLGVLEDGAIYEAGAVRHSVPGFA